MFTFEAEHKILSFLLMDVFKFMDIPIEVYYLNIMALHQSIISPKH